MNNEKITEEFKLDVKLSKLENINIKSIGSIGSRITEWLLTIEGA